METTTSTVERVGFGTRFGALLVDVVILIVLCLVLAPILGGFLGGLMGAAMGSTVDAAAGATSDEQAAAVAVGAAAGGIMGMIAGMILMVPFIYFVYYLIEGLTGVTLGKLILGIKVGSQDGTKAPVSALLTRYLIKSSGTLIQILAAFAGIAFLGTVGKLVALAIFVGCFFVLGKQKQSFHDMLSKTAVFKKGDLK
jgi:uncharacterized RDD family membrane protein YckC